MNGLYKNHHIQQMHSNGTTAYETLIAIFPSALLTFITVLLNSLLRTFVTNQTKYLFLIECMLLILPITLSITVLSHHLINILVALAVVVPNLIVLIYNIQPSKSVTDNRRRTDFITNARSTINVLSVIAILAVDFNIFPRHFAKTESFGYSLMDVGVGLFMYSNGIISPEARGLKDPLKKSIRSTLLLFVLGIARFVFVRQTDYNVSVSEYGTHWNFFITLAVTKICCAFVLNVIKGRFVFAIAIFATLVHEITLQNGLQEFALSNVKRDDLLTANKEGLVSVLGYVSIYLFSVAFGRFLHKSNRGKSVYTARLFIYSALAVVVSLTLQNFFGVSRKLANSAYCFWVLFIGVFMTAMYYLFQTLQEFLCRDKLNCVYSPLIFEAINYNGLLFFLVGNLLTGLVNLTFNTLLLNDRFSLAILLLYMFINCSVVTFLYDKRCKLKV